MFRFKELIELWRSDNLLTQALNDSHTMLESTKEMFEASVTSLRQSDKGEMGVDVYEKDQLVNKYEREVRLKVLKHLAITGGANIIPGLILTSIVIDIERIGDYTKNIKDLAVAHPKLLDCGPYDDDITKIERATGALFENAIPALKQSDKPVARELMNENWWMIKKCDEITISLIKSDNIGMPQGSAVATALYARYLKRITAHLINMLSSVVNPFEGIGFRGDDEV